MSSAGRRRSFAILALMELPLAHLGHWYFYPLYALPVIIVLGSVLLTMLRERRARRHSSSSEG